MSKGDLVTESRSVSDFDRVALSDVGELTITQGEAESLVIEAHRDLISKIKTEVRDGKLVIEIGGSLWDRVRDTLTTGLIGRWIKYQLTVKALTSLEIFGAARVKASDLKTDHLTLRLGGAGDVNVASLTAELLKVDLPGTGKIGVAGQVAQQTISITGAGNYSAPKLESKKATVMLRGAGKATVWAVEDLEVTITGLGNVAYYGSPTVKEKVVGLGSVTSLGDP
jgi:hypothetical protein